MKLDTPLKQQSTCRLSIAAKKYAYVIAFLPATLLPIAYYFGHHFHALNYWAFAPLVFFYIFLPIADTIVGRDSVNTSAEQDSCLSQQIYYRLLTCTVLPLHIANLIFAIWVFSSGELNIWGQLGWLISTASVGATFAINVGHELIHKPTRYEQWVGGVLLASVNYASFKVEHLRGHHVHVSTPRDTSSARYGQTLYHFIPRAMIGNFLNGWQLEAKRLRQHGLPTYHWRNELIWWYCLSAAFAFGSFIVWGWTGLLFYLLQGLGAGLFLEVVNYIEHYGLERRQLDHGRYEKTAIQHSWNSNFLITNLFLFQLQRHSDHHAYPRRRYQVLRHHDASPQLPSGYATMIITAFIPPLWFRIMNPKLKAYRRLSNKPA